ncbi:AAA family ATPase [Nocardioides lianchengensis]|uniref:Nuclease SbcCD subunit C n=1 Tax=Nocardioides lianchengensis TaxID=1045774 RepID=A0A1G7BAT7_9ACTN|nr:SMC family ATPase [Nocardioides lianchengensis]NYG10047.1 exonuclease SbcC [Nocardioides lianchengensis]SDE24082.1 exonuclease SbcC [Nocardioides lianchengensis]
MRLHHLEITAFGPFPDTVEVDFDQLSGAGLFLLSGPTGAGKTSVLDAVCFALYGDVPGDRATARRLRSDQAASGVAPRVTLEATLSGRRFRLVRSPAWERPKKRGSGTTSQQASVTVSERISGEWAPLTSRLDEAGHLISRLVGMNLTQFTQVAMLPQGRFQAFLRSRSEERHQLLQRLFRTGRFEDVERWLRDRRLELRRSSETAHQDVADLVSRVSEAATTPLPDEWDVRDLTAPAEAGSLASWSDRLLAEARGALAGSAAATHAATQVERSARSALDSGRATADQQARVEAAAAEHALLIGAADEHASARERVDAGRRAASVMPLWRVARAAREAHEVAAADVPVGVERTSVETTVAELADASARVRALRPRADRLVELDQRLAELQEHGREVTEALRVASERSGELPTRIATLRESLEEARAAAATVESAAARLAAHDELSGPTGLTALLERARAEHAEAREQTLTRRTTWLDLRQARLEGMAAEIAHALVVGESCPVCGSHEHPHKAARSADAPDASAEKAAHKAVDAAAALEHLREEEARDLATRHAVVTERAGDPAELDELRARHGGLRATAAGVPGLERTLAATESELAATAETARRLEADAAETTASLRLLGQEAVSHRAEVTRLLEPTPHGSLDDLEADLHDRDRDARALLLALDARDAAAARASESATALDAAARDAGFDDPAAAAAAALAPDVLERLAAQVADHDRRLANAEAILAEPGADQVGLFPPPDLRALTRAHDRAHRALTTARATEQAGSGRVERLSLLVSELGGALQRWAPVRAELDLTTRLASFVEGKAPDNRLQMRLSAYVLAYRLSQVVAAANERLARMSDQRYSLEHTGHRGAGETRGGLSLLIRDDWSGESRDPATLSGGETFVVSLALALGLADVITQETGGADLDTLFVDEGFGALDADTLDDVLDTLDSLRDGGRVVGVVSHVAEMRDRIPTQLVVTKARTGSTIAVTG